jgi:hypothetical protein
MWEFSAKTEKMPDQTKLLIFEEHNIQVGQDTWIASVAENNYAVVFEDNTETGYFYALSLAPTQTILDALHIYNVSAVKDKQKPSLIKILWTEDRQMAFLSINGYYHAVFDFKNQAGYCRNGFPNANQHWTRVQERTLTDTLLEELSRVV